MAKSLLALSLYFLLVSSVFAADADPLFQSTVPLDITLTGPFNSIDDDRDKEKEYEGQLSYMDESGTEVVLDLEYSVRGNWRLQKRNCNYSQLWLNLKRGQVEGTLFENQNRVKLVVQCRQQDRYAELIIKEQQAYQLFAEFSDYNFDTRLLNVTYVDSEEPDEIRTHRGFFIEHQNRLAERFSMDEVEENRVSYSDLDRDQSVLVNLFMYMIGNTDFSLIQATEGDECCHNAKLLLDDEGNYIPLPYDFDSSGHVNAPYAAAPNPNFGIRTNRNRVYRGFCVPPDVMERAVATILDKKDTLNSIVGDASYVSERTANGSIRFMEDFFETLEDSRSLERDIVGDCRG